MEVLKENLLSPRNPNSTGKTDSFIKRGEQSLKESECRAIKMQSDLSTFRHDQHLGEAVFLQQRWLELKERERRAQQHNRQLLMEFEKAQDTLREMVACTAAMNTVRVKYERYLDENMYRWQQQLEEKTLSAQRKRREDYLRRLEEEQMLKPSAEACPSTLKGHTKLPQQASAPHTSHEDVMQDGCFASRIPSVHPSWLTHTCSQMAPYPQASSYIAPSIQPPPIFQQPNWFQLHHFSPGPNHHHHHHHERPQQKPPPWATPQMEHPPTWPAGGNGFPLGPQGVSGWPQALGWGVVQGVEGEAERSTVPSPQGGRGGGGRSSCLSQELDIKPVRLSSGPPESSGSGGDSTSASRKQNSRERRKRREKRGARRGSSDRGESSSQGESSTSTPAIIASASPVQGSDADMSSDSGRRRRSGPAFFKPAQSGEKPRERTRSREDGGQSLLLESESQMAENQSPVGELESCREGSESVGMETEDGGAVELKPAQSEEKMRERTRSREDGGQSLPVESQSQMAENQSPVGELESCREGSESIGMETEDGGEAELEGQQEGCGSEGRSTEREDDEEGQGGGDEEQADDVEDDAVEDEESDRWDGGEEDVARVSDEERSVRKNATEKECEKGEDEEGESDREGEDEEQSGGKMNEGSAHEKEELATFQEGKMEEEAGQGSEDQTEEGDEEGSDGNNEGEDEEEEGGEEWRGEEAEEEPEERDSDDSIILSLEHRSRKKIHRIPEEEEELDGDGKDEDQRDPSSDSSYESNYDDDDIEQLLAPQEQTQKIEAKTENPEVDNKLHDANKDVKILTENSEELDEEPKSAQDTDEFDHFYD